LKVIFDNLVSPKKTYTEWTSSILKKFNFREYIDYIIVKKTTTYPTKIEGENIDYTEIREKEIHLTVKAFERISRKTINFKDNNSE
jgi:phage anti-repressor protein